MQYHKALTIAGSDSGGGAGIQADLKTFAALGCHGSSAITAVTAQNTLGVTAIHPIPTDIVEAQIAAVFEDMGAKAVKIGMLHSPEIIESVARQLRKYQPEFIVVDPVMVATSGDRLIQEEAVDALKEYLFPLATVITPNLPEASLLLGHQVDEGHMLKEAQELLQWGSDSVLLKGGHMSGMIRDTWVARGYTPLVISHEKVDTPNTHGTGCTLSSAITALLARGIVLENAIEKAIDYVKMTIMAGSNLHLGKGSGPVHHFFHYWKNKK
ncbi:bifunctional hydroxymethylpyrimidine kinase/phosphomethylpyrimidine kinase [Limibacter armeniacum]|uniref:bifunctional hydroxymethylpyrimidine kinase/phosphomethylpyrimidine kinase n=1 Tax=Limibacter armeniacum TaxID=466084 RepID=UPI002FE5BAEB